MICTNPQSVSPKMEVNAELNSCNTLGSRVILLSDILPQVGSKSNYALTQFSSKLPEHSHAATATDEIRNHTSTNHNDINIRMTSKSPEFKNLSGTLQGQMNVLDLMSKIVNCVQTLKRVAEYVNDNDQKENSSLDSIQNASNNNDTDSQQPDPSQYDSRFKYVWQWIANDGTLHEYNATTQILIDDLSIGKMITISAGQSKYEITKDSMDHCSLCSQYFLHSIHL